ncbi:MAG: hypothetical protein KC978_17550 [Candidatus Omnitrophica bacterium]|nr:hypothetical protein [Candidatus Omnitrophota bacterium]
MFFRPLIFVSLMLGLGSNLSWGQDYLIPFQGHLTQPKAGSPGAYEAVPDGQYDILFAIYTSPVGGESLAWGPERHEDLVVVNGLVNAILGSVIGFDQALEADRTLFSKALYVGITIDADGNPNTADLEMVPRQVYLPAVSAITAQNLQGSEWKDFFISQGGGDPAENPDNALARNADKLKGHDWSDILVGGSNDPTSALIRGDRVNIPPVNVDNQSIENPGGLLQVKDGGITQEKLAEDIQAFSNLNYQVSPQVDSFRSVQGGQWEDILDEDVAGNVLSVTIATTGRPVYLSLIGSATYPTGDPLTNNPKESSIDQRQTNSTSRYFSYYRILRNGQPVYQARYKIDGWNVGEATEYSLPPGMIQTVDFPPAGTHNYKIQVYSISGFANAYYLRLFAMEL